MRRLPRSKPSAAGRSRSFISSAEPSNIAHSAISALVHPWRRALTHLAARGPVSAYTHLRPASTLPLPALISSAIRPMSPTRRAWAIKPAQ